MAGIPPTECRRVSSAGRERVLASEHWTNSSASELQQVLSALFVEVVVEIADSRSGATFASTTDSLGDLRLLQTRLLEGAVHVHRSESVLRRSLHNHFFLALIVEGDITFQQGGRDICLVKGDIALLDSAEPYSVLAESTHHVLWLQIPRYRLLGRLPSCNELTAQRVSGTQGLGAIATSMLQTAVNQLPLITHQEGLRVANAVLDLTSLCLKPTSMADLPRPVLLLSKIQDFIETHLDDADLSLPMIAERHGVSVRYLNKLFEQDGVSAAKWIRMRRLERCRQDIESKEYRHITIGEIAFRNGFNDASSFSRAFKAWFGVSPTSLRDPS